uniref:Uncharacterized protein n=1 Tax=Myotis myotis TaxID=51298 RepID=A0A7J7WHT4_MYOMY|nr:hypothetical protein mMyoMyo1_012156 [Myotis myotis]
MDDLNKNTHYPESPELLQKEIMGWTQKIQKKEEEKQRPEQANTGLEQVLQDRLCQPLSVAGNAPQTLPEPDRLGDHSDDRNLEFPPKRETENRDRFVHGSQVDLKGVPPDADINVTQENQEIARQLWKQKRMNEELAAEI